MLDSILAYSACIRCKSAIPLTLDSLAGFLLAMGQASVDTSSPKSGRPGLELSSQVSLSFLESSLTILDASDPALLSSRP